MRSWKTTCLGALMILSAIIGVIVTILTGDTVNWEIVGASILAGLGLLAARDNDKTSGDVGAGTKLRVPLILLLLVPFLLIGCTSPQSDRGSVGETIVAIDMDFNFDGVARDSRPAVKIDDAGEYYEPVISAVVTAAEDGEVTDEEALAIAKVAGRHYANVMVLLGGIHIEITGDSQAASAGETTQTATGPDIDADIEVPIIP